MSLWARVTFNGRDAHIEGAAPGRTAISHPLLTNKSRPEIKGSWPAIYAKSLSASGVPSLWRMRLVKRASMRAGFLRSATARPFLLPTTGRMRGECKIVESRTS